MALKGTDPTPATTGSLGIWLDSPVGERDDEVVHACGLGGANDGPGIGLSLEAGDVVADGPRQQLDGLRQVTDVPSENLGRPLVESAPSSRTLPRTGVQTPTKRRASEDLPDALGPMMPSPWPLLSVNDASCTTSLVLPGGVTLPFQGQLLAGAPQGHQRAAVGPDFEHVLQPLPALPGGRPVLPVGDRQIERFEGAPGQDRTGNDDACGRLPARGRDKRPRPEPPTAASSAAPVTAPPSHPPRRARCWLAM